MKLVDAELICDGGRPDADILCACGSDMMSDVLAFTKSEAVLLTGLVNNHVLRTAEIIDLQNILFVRGKRPTPELVEMAEEMNLCLMATNLPMFTACGILYENGVAGGTRGI